MKMILVQPKLKVSLELTLITDQNGNSCNDWNFNRSITRCFTYCLTYGVYNQSQSIWFNHRNISHYGDLHFMNIWYEPGALKSALLHCSSSSGYRPNYCQFDSTLNERIHVIKVIKRLNVLCRSSRAGPVFPLSGQKKTSRSLCQRSLSPFIISAAGILFSLRRGIGSHLILSSFSSLGSIWSPAKMLHYVWQDLCKYLY